MSGAVELLIQGMRERGWVRIGRGVGGELWRGPDGREVAIPFGLTVDSWEWPGIVARVAPVERS